MSGPVHDLGGMPFEVTTTTGQVSYAMLSPWRAFCGTATWNFMLDTRVIAVGSGSVLSVIPTVQFAETRADRPDAPGVVSGSAAMTVGLTPYVHTPSGIGSKLFYRTGVAYWLSTVGATAFGRAQGILYGASRDFGVVYPPVEVNFQPTNDTNAVSFFPLVRSPIVCAGADKGKLIVHGMGNVNATLGWQLAGRGFNDPLARGGWTLLEGNLDADWNVPGQGNFPLNTGEVSLSGLNLGTTNFFFEPALAVRKTLSTDANSRCDFHAVFALKLA